jgi:hypothetical protein
VDLVPVACVTLMYEPIVVSTKYTMSEPGPFIGAGML